MKTNHHSHTVLCNHAEGTVEEHIIHAIKQGYEVFGISEHTPLEVINNIPPKRAFLNRMSISDLDQYILDVNYCKEKYKNQIEILVGLEAEYFESHHDFFKKLSKRVDYLAFGNHDILYEGKYISSFNITKDEYAIEYATNAERAFKTGFYKFMTHPDLYLLKYEWNDTAAEVAEIISQASIKYNVPLEFNANGIRRGLVDTKQGKRYLYPRKEFWEIVKKHKCKVIVNSDAHQLDEHNDEHLEETYRLAREWKLNLIEILE
ncbi:histidinol-phosphatase [Mycoplasmatota bacterium WC44]